MVFGFGRYVTMPSVASAAIGTPVVVEPSGVAGRALRLAVPDV